MEKKSSSRLTAALLRCAAKRPELFSTPDDAPYADSTDDGSSTRETKRRRTGTRSSGPKTLPVHHDLFIGGAAEEVDAEPCALPSRRHRISYHRPLLLYSDQGCEARKSLLEWFDSKSTTRSMPWRQAWVNPQDLPDPAERRQMLERRAYRVWISEIMLQQTRVAVVIDYWNRWMARWPTIQDLARADRQDVLVAWQGLGYYSRATRIHEAAQLVVNDPDMRGLLPQTVKELEARIPGVGRYTAGAISAIVFGCAEPMVDGNVLRVLSRQLGIYGNVKSNKRVIDTLWAAADALAKAVAEDGRPGKGAEEPSDRPGRWGQGLMELGSTVCTPNPTCSACPITSTCRVYNEARASAKGGASVSNADIEIEDLCVLCEPFEEAQVGDEGDQKRPAKKSKAAAKQTTLSTFAFTRQNTSSKDSDAESKSALEVISKHARRFPAKVVKKAVRQEETLVCAIRRSGGCYLIHQRPDKGLLAGLWEFPSQILDGSGDERINAKERQRLAREFVGDLLQNGQKKPDLRYVGETGTVPWVFSHLKLTMHVHLFTLKDESKAIEGPSSETETTLWSADVDAEPMGTGMRKCWALVRDATPSI